MKRGLVLAMLGVLTGCPAEAPAVEGSSTSGGSESGSVGVSETGVVTGSAGESGSTNAVPTTGEATTLELDESGSSASTSGAVGSTSGGSDSGGGDSGGGDSETGVVAVCGDGAIEGAEQCDDGNDDPNDACDACVLGPADAGEGVAIILLPDEQMQCFTRAADGLALGAYQVVWGEEGHDMFGHVQQVPLPGGAPAGWSYYEKGGDFGRWPQRAATASNGDVIVAGMIYEEIKHPDAGYHLWLARFTPAGALVWSLEQGTPWMRAQGLVVGPTGDVVVSGYEAGLGGASATVAAYSGAGALLWTFNEPQLEWPAAIYQGVAVDGAGQVYVVGNSSTYAEDWQLVEHRLVLRGLSAAGAPLWLVEESQEGTLGTYAGDLVLTVDGTLVHSAVIGDLEDFEAPTTKALVAYDTSGAKLWTQEWEAQGPWRGSANRLVAATGGGVYLAGGGYLGEDQVSTLIGRFAADGSPMWLKLAPGSAAVDALIGADARLYVLTADALVAFSP